jgi:NAD(P)-dependent dehydrogenase (short-subunit alcohol dehydrogenase family)
MNRKTVLITGSSTGFGHATAKLFADKGWNVVATMRDVSTAEDLAGRDNVLVSRLDVTDPASIDGTKRLRYLAGDDVKHFVEARRKLSDEDYENYMRAQFA